MFVLGRAARFFHDGKELMVVVEHLGMLCKEDLFVLSFKVVLHFNLQFLCWTFSLENVVFKVSIL